MWCRVSTICCYIWQCGIQSDPPATRTPHCILSLASHIHVSSNQFFRRHNLALPCPRRWRRRRRHPPHSELTVALFIFRPTDPLLSCRRLTGVRLQPRHLAPPTQGSACGRGMLEYDRARHYLGCHTCIPLLQTHKLAIMGHLESC